MYNYKINISDDSDEKISWKNNMINAITKLYKYNIELPNVLPTKLIKCFTSV